MSKNQKELAKAAIYTGSFLANLVQVKELPADQLKGMFDLIIDNLNVMGVDIELDELKKIDKMSKEDAVTLVRNIKSRILSAIEHTCGSTISDWFDLSFSLWLLGTSPETIPLFEEHLNKLAISLGYGETDFANILQGLKTGDYHETMGQFVKEAFEIITTPCLFISYSSEDAGLAKELAQLCEEAHIHAFVANINILPGTDWYHKLKEEIYKSEEILLLLTPHSAHSPWVMIEVGAAWALDKPITPAAIEYSNIKSLPEPIKKFQVQDITTMADRKKLIDVISQRIHNQS